MIIELTDRQVDLIKKLLYEKTVLQHPNACTEYDLILLELGEEIECA